jgi:hypothetical protein
MYVIIVETTNKLHLSIIPWLRGAGQVQGEPRHIIPLSSALRDATL